MISLSFQNTNIQCIRSFGAIRILAENSQVAVSAHVKLNMDKKILVEW